MGERRPPSMEFMASLRHSGTAIIKCEHCERILFAPGSDLDFDQEEMDDLVKAAEDDPDKYVLINEDGVIWGYLDNKHTPLDCPCNAARPWEDWIWHHRHLIVKYLKARVSKMQDDLASEVATVAGLDVEGTFGDEVHTVQRVGAETNITVGGESKWVRLKKWFTGSV